MAAFSRKSLKSNPFMSAVRRHPFAFFGLPFLSLVVFSSYALETFTQTRYNHNDYKVQAVSQEEALRMDKNRKRVDIREEYYRMNNPGLLGERDSALQAAATPSSSGAPPAPKKKKSIFDTLSQDEYEPIRVPRPDGVSEWGAAGGASPDAPVKGQRREDRWV